MPLSISKRVRLRGWCDNPASILFEYKYFISTSLYEGMPLVLLEAMVAHCYLIVTDIPEHHETICANNYLSFYPKDHLDLLRAIEVSVSRNLDLSLPKYQLIKPEERASQIDQIYQEI